MKSYIWEDNSQQHRKWSKTTIPQQSEMRQHCPLRPLLSSGVFEELFGAIGQEKEIKGIQTRKEVKLCLFIDDIYIKDPKNSTRKPRNDKPSNMAGNRINLHRPIDFFYTLPANIQRRR